jgi:elongator complex protein 1
VALWDLGTRLESGRGNVMNPIKVWEEVVGDECRQIKSWPTDVLDQDRLTGRLIVLGSGYDGCDMVTLVDLDSDKLTRTRRIQMPKHSGRLVESESIIVWQAPDGELFEGTWLHTSSYAFCRIAHVSQLG